MVHRHGPMVLGVCRRNLTDPGDAEDAFQATFLVLARRAGAVRPGGNLGRWLYGVARKIAARARLASARRPEAAHGRDPATDPAADAQRTDLRESLDAELVRLPEKYRAAIVLCHLEGLSVREAAERLGCPTGTVCVRLARGRNLLKDGLIRRGIAPAFAVGLAAGTSVPEISAATEALIATTIRFATHPASPSGSSPVRAVRLAEEVLRTMWLTKSKMIAAAAAAVLVAIGTGVRAQQKGPGQPPQATAPRAEGPPVELALAEMPAPDDEKTAYPIELKPDKVYELADVSIKVHHVEIHTGPVTVVPIGCAKGITGAMILGGGKSAFLFSHGGARPIDGDFRAAMLRFNPADQPRFLPISDAKPVADLAAFEMSRHLLNTVFGHCWHSGKDALIPPVGSLSAVLYSKEYGDLLVSDDGKNPVVHNFTSRKTLFEKK
jgi:RNA polymerase sigma factor (sigma-70 family)